MQDFPLTITAFLRHGGTVYGAQRVRHAGRGDGAAAGHLRRGRRATPTGSRPRSPRSAIGAGDRVGTFCWNDQEHLEAYFAVPGMGAVLHTLNIRLFPEQLTYVINHAEDRVVIVDDTLVPLLASVAADLQDGRALHRRRRRRRDRRWRSRRRCEVLRYEERSAAEEPGFAWPEIDERAAAAMCYTSGTTGNPKGVVYSHRSTFLHSLAVNDAERDRSHASAIAVPADRADVPRQRVGPPVRGVVHAAPTS